MSDVTDVLRRCRENRDCNVETHKVHDKTRIDIRTRHADPDVIILCNNSKTSIIEITLTKEAMIRIVLQTDARV
jgi:hypothetical protein